MKERNCSFDIMRVFACIMIICMHAPYPSANAHGLFLSSLSYFTAPGLCLFFVISGALLLPVTTDTKSFLMKRLGKVVMPTICFTFLYLILKAVNGEDIDWIRIICSIPFSAQGHGVLWFIYTLICLYMVAPIISKWLETASKREEWFYLGLWAITLCYPILRIFLNINVSETGILFYFTGYLGYFVLGHYLRTYHDITLRGLAIPVIISIAVPVVCKVFHLVVDFESLFWYLSIFVAVLCTTIYVIVSKISKKVIRGGEQINESHIPYLRPQFWNISRSYSSDEILPLETGLDYKHSELLSSVGNNRVPNISA